MLDHRFVRLARGLRPVDKANMRFLSRILLTLDPALGDTPLDGRPLPLVYAEPSVRHQAEIRAVAMRRVVRKVRQRVTGGRRVPAGGAIVAAKVADHWRRQPSDLDAVRSLGVFSEQFVDQVCSGEVTPDSASVALLLNLEAAAAG